MDTKIVTIDLDARSYDIFIGPGLLYRVDDFIPFDLGTRSVFVICDQYTQVFGERVLTQLRSAGARMAQLYPLPAGEQTKSFAHIERLCDWLLEHEVGRDSVLVAVGGGVTGDVTGFCASIIMRGIPYIQIPTTLLAQVDSAVGGKTGINTPKGKNLVGSFYQPAAVIADTDTLKTLPRREFLAGYAELAKYGLIRDAAFFEWLEQHGQEVCAQEPAALMHAIEIASKAKAEIVQSDERETSGQRALLNLGHTFGHALETAAGYDGRLLHGEAVAIGMCMAFDLSVRMGLCPAIDHQRVEEHLMSAGLPTRASLIDPPIKASVSDLIATMRHDKKAAGGKLKFILVNGIGQAFVESDVPETMVGEVLKDSLAGGQETTRKGIKERWKSAFYSR